MLAPSSAESVMLYTGGVPRPTQQVVLPERSQELGREAADRAAAQGSRDQRWGDK